MNAKQKIEQYFNLSFKDVINKLHFEKQLSINSLSKLCKISRDTFSTLAKKDNLKLRSLKESAKLTKNKGANHWAFGLKRPDASKRMKKDNPCFKNSNLIKMAISKSKFLKNNPLPIEKTFKFFLDKYKVKYIFQYPINRYIVDFFIPKNNLCIELDSMDKWGKTKRNKAFNRRDNLIKLGFKVINLPRLKINELYILNILDTNNIIFQR